MSNHSFDYRTVPSNWLSNLSYKFHELLIISSNLNNFENEAFDSVAFNDLNSLIIDGGLMEETTLNFDNCRGFNGLNNLQNLEITNFIAISSNKTFQAITSTLESMKLTKIESSIILRSLFGYYNYNTLKKLDISWNQFTSPGINSMTFTGIQDIVEELYMTNSKISSIPLGTFDNFSSLKILDVQNNNLVTLPLGIFEIFVDMPDFRVYLAYNPWRCDAEICHLKHFIQEEDQVLCGSPPEYQNDTVLSFALCPTSTVDTSPGISSSSERPSTTESKDC